MSEPRVCGQDVFETYFGRTVDRRTVRVSNDGESPILWIGDGRPARITRNQAREIADALLEAANIL